MNNTARVSAVGSVVVTLIWIGLLLGVSFLATPAKFLAPSLTLPSALDVGRHTFGIFSAVEVVAATVLVTCTIASGSGRAMVLGALVLAGCVALQFWWLLPALDARVEVILQGGVPVTSRLHDLYIALEVGKLVLLVFLAWASFHARHLLLRVPVTDAS